MKRGLYPIIAGVLVSLLLLSGIFEKQLNSLSTTIGILILALVTLLGLVAIQLAFRDTETKDKPQEK